MDFKEMITNLLSKKSVVIVNINEEKEKDERLIALIERLIKLVSGQNKSTPMG